MKHISELVEKEIKDPRKSFDYRQPFVSPNYENETAAVVNEIFEKMECIFSGFKHVWPNDTAIKGSKREWVLAFMDSGIKEIEKINQGLTKLRLLDTNFPPSPGQFIKLCQEPTKEIKPLSDTRDKLMLEKWENKTDDEKARSKRIGEHHLSNILAMLKK